MSACDKFGLLKQEDESALREEALYEYGGCGFASPGNSIRECGDSRKRPRQRSFNRPLQSLPALRDERGLTLTTAWARGVSQGQGPLTVGREILKAVPLLPGRTLLQCGFCRGDAPRLPSRARVQVQFRSLFSS
jgi:hypothetical protein